MKKSIKISFIVITIFIIQMTAFAQNKFYPKLQKYVAEIEKEFQNITPERKDALIQIAEYVLEQHNQNQKASIVFICTHNSRRSQFGQIWGWTAAQFYGIDQVSFFSGGTEATACNPRTVEALKRAGFQIRKGGNDNKNPTYEVSLGKTASPILLFSKKYSHIQNPKKDFAAVMVCSDADKSCPVVEGASARISLPYEDPKAYDNTPSESIKYDERCKNIAVEMFFVFQYIKTKKIEISESKLTR
jgi:hypothetical protein